MTISVDGPSECSLYDGSFTITGLSGSVSYDYSFDHNNANYSGSKTTTSTGVLYFTGLGSGDYANITLTISGQCMGSGSVTLTADTC